MKKIILFSIIFLLVLVPVNADPISDLIQDFVVWLSGDEITGKVTDNPGEPIILHRTTRRCATGEALEKEQVIDLRTFRGGTYTNYKCESRYKGQCTPGDPYDTYYDEWCEYEGDLQPEEETTAAQTPEQIGINPILPEVICPNPTEGDLNGDGKINIFDETIMLNYLKGKFSRNDVKIFSCIDLNGDGIVNTFDHLKLLNLIKEASQPAITCTDSDNSPDYNIKRIPYPITPSKYPDLFVKGYGKGIYVSSDYHFIIGQEPDPLQAKPSPNPYTTYYDYCVDTNQLNEAFCLENGRLSGIGVKCPNGCKDGACVEEEPEPTVECFRNRDCDSLNCVNGICQPMDCQDSDNGRNYYIKGVVTGIVTLGLVDSCLDAYGSHVTEAKKLVEYFCPTYELDTNSETIDCPYSCKDGACVLGLSESIYYIGGKGSFANGKIDFRLENIGTTGSIVVNVDGKKETIPLGYTEIVNDLKITNRKGGFYNIDDPVKRYVILKFNIPPVDLGNNIYSFGVGDVEIVYGKEIELLNVGSQGAVIVDVDGVKETLSYQLTETVNGLDITVISTYYDDSDIERGSLELSSAKLKVVLSEEEPAPPEEESGLVALGDTIVGEFMDGKGILSLGIGPNNLGASVETSLTAYEDDYQTDIVMEVNRDAIKYTLNNLGSLISATLEDPIILELMGQKVHISRVLTDTSLMIGGLNGGEVRDGDAFYGEDLDDPNWVWNLDNLRSNNPIIGIENDFIINDDSDNPPEVGECIELPFGYASICLDGLNVEDYEYDTYTIELDMGFKLNNLYAPSVYIHTKGKNMVSELDSEYIWITGGGEVYYRDNKDIVRYWKNISDGKIGTIGPSLDLTSDIVNNNLYINVNSMSQKTTLASRFKLGPSVDKTSTGVISLGNINSMEEADELSYGGYGKDPINIGTKDEDHRNSYGIIIRDPKAHGASDEVVLEIPIKQVKAKVSVEFKEISEREQEEERKRSIMCKYFGNIPIIARLYNC